MDFEKIHEPYRDNDSPSVEAQKIWLSRKGIPAQFIDQTFLTVYSEIEEGKTSFQPKEVNGQPYGVGAQLCHYLLNTARRLQKEDAAAQLKRLEEFHTNLVSRFQDKWREEMAKAPIPGVWKRIKAVFKP